jgi:hypothetical protein
MLMSDFSSLQAIADRQAITDLIYRYCRAVDRIDHELGYSIWHDDGMVDYGNYYQGGHRGLIDKICANHLQMQCHSHQMTNIIIELDGDRASSESYVTAYLRIERNGQLKQMTVLSRYIDTWSRRHDHWGIDKRIAIRDLDEIRDITPMSPANEGSRDKSDRSYAVLRQSF